MVHLLLAVAIAAAPGKPHKVKLAVLDVEDVSGTEPAKARLLTQVISGDLPKLGEFDVMSPSDIKNMIGFEKQKQLLGCKDDSCLAELGGALGVDYLVSAQLGKLGSRYRLDMRLLDAGHSRVAASEGDFIPGNDDALADAAEKMLRKVLDDSGLRAKAPAVESSQAVAEPAGGLAQPSPEGSSHTGAFVAAGGAVVLAAAATYFTIQAKNRYADDHNCYTTGMPAPDPGKGCGDKYSPNTDSLLADVLWAGTIAAAGTSTFLFLSAGPGGSGGEVGVRGRF